MKLTVTLWLWLAFLSLLSVIHTLQVQYYSGYDLCAPIKQTILRNGFLFPKRARHSNILASYFIHILYNRLAKACLSHLLSLALAQGTLQTSFVITDHNQINPISQRKGLFMYKLNFHIWLRWDPASNCSQASLRFRGCKFVRAENRQGYGFICDNSGWQYDLKSHSSPSYSYRNNLYRHYLRSILS